jgi:hypothetical protein
VFTCCTKYVGETIPDRTATRNFTVLVHAPSAAAQVTGSGRENPNAISSDSMPNSSARNANCLCAAMSGTPLLSAAALALRIVSPTEDRLQ